MPVYSPRPMPRSLATAVAVALLLGPALARADDAPAVASEETVVAVPAVDDQGRPFPDPALVAEGKIRTVVGVAATGVGAGLMVGGLFLGSSVARGEVAGNPPTYTALGGLLGGGLGLVSFGIPTLSVGVYTTKQLDRTIKGAEKVPRTVANEKRFWNAVMGEHVGRTIAINGGGTLLMGVVSVAGVVATVDTEYYKPWYWATVAGAFGGGAGLVGLGVLIEQNARKKQEAIRDEVDPYRKKRREEAASESEAASPPPPSTSSVEPILGVPVPTFVPLPPTATAPGGVAVGLGWSFAF